MFGYYYGRGKLYIWIDKDGEKYQFHFESWQFMDSRDREITQEKLHYFRTEHPVLKKLFNEYEDSILGNPDSCYYALYVLKGRFEKGEDEIFKEKKYSEAYHDFLKMMNAKN